MSQPFDAGRGLIVVPAELFGPSGSVVLHLAVDTGATQTMINVGLLAFAGYDPSLVPDRVQVTTGSGVEYTPRVPVERIEVLGQERRDFRCSRIRCHPARRSMACWASTTCASSG